MTVTVCHINLARGFRGGERQTELLIRRLSDRGVSQRLVARKAQPLTRRLEGVPGMDCRPVAGNALAAARACHGAALVHAHESHGAHAAFLRYLVSRIPYVITRRVSNVPGGDFFTRGVYRKAAMTACVSGSVARVLEAYEPGLRTRVIHSSVSALDTDPGQVERLRQTNAGRFLVLHVATLDNKTKGQIYIIRAARMLAGSSADIHFLLVGGGADEAWLRKEAAGLDNVSFTGFVENVGDYLAAADLFILPSNIEGIGGILLDAMQFGLPVIASRVGGLPEIVHDGDNGLLIPARDPQQLHDAILRLRHDEALRIRMGRGAREFAAAFGPDHMAAEYGAMYESVLGVDLT